MDRRQSIATSRNARKIALLLQYDGTNFIGWQKQKEGRTVQSELEKALRILLRENVSVIASGRTDSGVHALGQVVHFVTTSEISLQRLCIGLNGILAEDISVLNAFNVPFTFHARFSAIEREYLYLVYNNPQRSPFMVNRAMWISTPLDAEYLNTVAQYLVGEKDFASFCKRSTSTKNTIRKISEIEVRRDNEIVRFRIKGNAFLHNMVRIIVGTMLHMHRTNAKPEEILEILNRRNRTYSGPTIVAKGLYLNRIFFDPPLESMEKAF
ncbi:MAG: tRNA pseudouridine(38-40) synthase TruA [Spirochaetes bacterium]|nr:tRNA pseudouridine(38-40) synthase TruA [Spirochaetota bacterium]